MSTTPDTATGATMAGATFLAGVSLAAACYVTYIQRQEEAEVENKARRRDKQRKANLKHKKCQHSGRKKSELK